MTHALPNPHFEKATLAHKDVIFEWLEEPHVREFWDNSPEHCMDIEIFMKGRQEATPYHNGIFDYWVGSIEIMPYCLLMTSTVNPKDDLPEGWGPYLSKTGKTFSIDFMIGNKDYFGKGLAAPTLKAFTGFITDKVDRAVDTFIIDPNKNNPRAKHVYEKAGFKIIGGFMRRGENFYLMVKTMPHHRV